MLKTPKSYKRTGWSPYPRTGVRSKISNYAMHRAALESVRRELFPNVPRPLSTAPKRLGRARFSPESIGLPKGISTCKNTTYTANVEPTMWSAAAAQITNCSKGTGISQRLTNSIDCSGVKVEMFIRNKNTTQGTPAGIPSDQYQYNVAVLAPMAAIAINENDFFRSVTNADSRTIDFATAVSSMDLHTLPINTDKFTVLAHKRFRLSNPSNPGGGTWKKDLNFYIPVNRQLTYTGEGFDTCQNPIFLVYWVSKMFRPNGDGSTGFPVADMAIRATMFFREPSGV